MTVGNGMSLQISGGTGRKFQDLTVTEVDGDI
jgi:hypothetical protein